MNLNELLEASMLVFRLVQMKHGDISSSSSSQVNEKQCKYRLGFKMHQHYVGNLMLDN